MDIYYSTVHHWLVPLRKGFSALRLPLGLTVGPGIFKDIHKKPGLSSYTFPLLYNRLEFCLRHWKRFGKTASHPPDETRNALQMSDAGLSPSLCPFLTPLQSVGIIMTLTRDNPLSD